MALTPDTASGALAVVADGATLTTLGLGDLQFIRRGLQLLASSLAQRDGGVPATVRSLQGLLERVTVGAAAAGRLPRPEVLGSDGSDEAASGGTVEGMEIRKAAKVLGCGQRNVRDLVARGALPARKSAGRWLIDPLDLQDLLDSRRSA